MQGTAENFRRTVFCNVGHTSVAGDVLASRQVHGVVPMKSGWHRGSKAKLYSSLTEEGFFCPGRLGIFHGMKSYFCQDEYGQIAPVYSISAGLDYPGIGPEHAWLHDIGRAEYVAVTDDEAVNAFEYLARTEGIIPAIESAHAVAQAIKLAPAMDKDKIIVITISGRGDKDCAAIARYRGEDLHE